MKTDRDSPSPGAGALQRVDHRLHRAAVALAEELDVERAAQRLQISVPELKERIDQLECKLSLVLFEWDSHHVALTADGNLYIEQLRKSRLL
jgi:DNA-binding transcriptional LysR family regulator